MTDSTEKKVDQRTVQLKRVRLSFAEGLVEKKKATEESEPKHSCNLLIECNDDADPKAKAAADENKRKCLLAIEAACDQQWGKKDRWKTIQEDNPKRVSFRKGERFRNDDGEVYKGYAGNFVISASGPKAGQHRPKMFDRHRVELSPAAADYLKKIEEVCYSGTYADVFVSFYGGDKGGAGVFASIEAIRSHQDGERTAGGGVNVSSDMFDAFDDEDDAFAGTGVSSSDGGGSGDFDALG